MSSVELGANLRALRRQRGYSLAQVAEGTNISRSFLVLVEGGKSDITITKLMRLTQFLGVHIADVLPDGTAADTVLVRRGEGQRVSSPAEGLEVFLLSRHRGRSLSPVLAEFAPGGSSESSQHDGEEFIHVIEGRFHLLWGDEEPILLEAGDSAHFASDRPHVYRNISEEPGRLLSVVTPAVF